MTRDTLLVRLSAFNERTLLNNKEVSWPQIESAVRECRERKGVLWIYSEAKEGIARDKMRDLLSELIQSGPEFRSSSMSDFGDLIEEQRTLRRLMRKTRAEEQGAR